MADLKKIMAVFLACGVIAGNVYAQQGGTLEKISRSNVIAIGHRESSIPFSYYDERQQVVGYSQEFTEAVVSAVKQKLNRPTLQRTLMPLTSQNRISLLQNGTVDIECGSTTNNLERQNQVAFSNTIFIIEARLLVKKGSGINDFSDLKGKTVVTTAGTTSERVLRKLKQEKGLPKNIISAKDHGEAFLALESGRAAAFMMDDALLAGERAKSKQAQTYEIVGSLESVGLPSLREAYGCMMRKGDPEFKALVNEAIADIERSGKADQFYKKWFQSPIPPSNLNLNFPLSKEMAELYKNPNDKALN